MDQARISTAETGVEVAVIVAASRLSTLDARTLARLASQYAGDQPGEVVGFGLSNDETAGVPRSSLRPSALSPRGHQVSPRWRTAGP